MHPPRHRRRLHFAVAVRSCRSLMMSIPPLGLTESLARPACRVAWTLLGFLLLLMGATAWGASPALQRCLANDRSCNPACLTPVERTRLLAVKRQEHLRDCLAGGRCNVSRLSPADRDRVQVALERQNVEACLRGEGACRQNWLTDPQREAVSRAASARNLEFCLSGMAACNPVPLSDDERARVREAYLQRNFMGCMNTVGTLVACDPDALSPAQREQVHRRNLAANEYVCMHALMGCNEALLTPEQRERRAALPTAAFR